MQSLNRKDLEARKADLQTALQQVTEEYHQLIGAIRLIETLVSELDEAPAQSEENNQ